MMSATEKKSIEEISGENKGEGAVLTLPAEAVEVLDLLVFRWRHNREQLAEAVRAIEFGAETVEMIEALATKWIALGLGVFSVEPGEGFGAKCHEGINA